MKDFITKYFPQLTVVAVAIYALVWYLIYWFAEDWVLASLIAAALVLLDGAVLAWLFREEIKARLGIKGP